MRWILGIVALTIGVFGSAPALAQQVSASASISPQQIYVGDTATYTISVNNGQTQSPPAVSGIPGVSVAYQNSSQNQSMSIINGRRTSKNTQNLIYAVRPTRPGPFVIPGQTVEIGGQTYTTNPVNAVVIEPPLSDLSPLRIVPERDTVYVGEPVRLGASWQIGETITEGFRFVTEGADGIEWTSGPQPAGSRNSPAVRWDDGQYVGVLGQTSAAGGDYSTLGAERWFVPLEPGTLTIGPVVAVYDVQTGRQGRLGLRSRSVERRMTRSNTATIGVKPLPLAGRPADFDGLVGRYTAAASASPLKVRVGDPITLTYEIRSEGPMGRIGPPDLQSDPGIAESFKLDPEGWEEVRMGQPGVRRYSTTVRALRDSINEFPPLGFSFFDTRDGAYERAESRRIPLLVDATREVTAEDAIGGAFATGALPGVDRSVLGGGQPGVLANSTSTSALTNQQTLLLVRFEDPVWIAVAAAPPAGYLALLGLLAVRRRSDPVGRRRSGARRAALSTLRSTGDAERAVRRYLSMRFDREAAALTESDCRELLGPIDREVAEELAGAMLGGAAERYGDRALPEPSAERVAALIRSIDREGV